MSFGKPLVRLARFALLTLTAAGPIPSNQTATLIVALHRAEPEHRSGMPGRKDSPGKRRVGRWVNFEREPLVSFELDLTLGPAGRSSSPTVFAVAAFSCRFPVMDDSASLQDFCPDQVAEACGTHETSDHLLLKFRWIWSWRSTTRSP